MLPLPIRSSNDQQNRQTALASMETPVAEMRSAANDTFPYGSARWNDYQKVMLIKTTCTTIAITFSIHVSRDSDHFSGQSTVRVQQWTMLFVLPLLMGTSQTTIPEILPSHPSRKYTYLKMNILQSIIVFIHKQQSPPNGELNLIAKSKEQELLRLKAIIQAIGFNPTVFDQLVIKCQEVSFHDLPYKLECWHSQTRIIDLDGTKAERSRPIVPGSEKAYRFPWGTSLWFGKLNHSLESFLWPSSLYWFPPQHCAGFRKEVTPSNREILDLTQQIRQLSYELKSKDEYIGQLHAECQLKDENLELVKRQLVCKES